MSDNVDMTTQAVEAEVKPEEKKPEVEYYTLPESVSARNRIWSILSFIFAILSVALCPFYYVSFALAVLAMVCSIVMRRSLGFFTSGAIAGLIIGIMGLVFSICSFVVDITGLYALIFGH